MNDLDANALDRHITGNWGEDSVPDEHTSGGQDCGDTTGFSGECVVVVDGPYGFVAGQCECDCHEDES